MNCGDAEKWQNTPHVRRQTAQAAGGASRSHETNETHIWEKPVIINSMRVNAALLLVGVGICVGTPAASAADGPVVPAGNTAACEAAATCPAAGPARLTVADYDRAAQVLDSNLRGKVRNAVVAPRWISGSDVFWYRRDGADGPEYVIVDAPTGAKTPAFDMARLAAAASQAARGTPAQPRDLSVVKIDGASEPRSVVLAQRGRGRFTCALPGYTCTFTPAVETGADARRSPDQSEAVFARDNDLWIRDLKSGAERRLTTDGQSYFSYGKQPDSSSVALPRLRSPVASPPWGISWSPNGRTIVGIRIDEHSVPPYPYVEWVPQDGSFRPITYQLRLPLLGDPAPPHDYFLLDAASGAKQEIKLPTGWSFASIAWSSDGRHVFGLASSFGSRDAALVDVDVNTGETRTVVKESSPTSLSFNTFVYNIANVRILGGGREAVWWSERDGWGHLYLYDIATGELKRQMTSGPWLVRDIIRVDQDRRQVYFTATGREPGEDPYYRHLYRVSLDGGTPIDLTPGAADHAFEAPLNGFIAAFLGGAIDDGQKVSPSGRYVVDTTTTVDQPPVTVLRATESTDVVATLEQADASAVFAAGWHAPGAPVDQGRGWPHRHQRRRLSAARLHAYSALPRD
jgi:dipeptidyl-peptidase 4